MLEALGLFVRLPRRKIECAEIEPFIHMHAVVDVVLGDLELELSLAGLLNLSRMTANYSLRRRRDLLTP